MNCGDGFWILWQFMLVFHDCEKASWWWGGKCCEFGEEIGSYGFFDEYGVSVCIQ